MYNIIRNLRHQHEHIVQICTILPVGSLKVYLTDFNLRVKPGLNQVLLDPVIAKIVINNCLIDKNITIRNQFINQNFTLAVKHVYFQRHYSICQKKTPYGQVDMK